MSFGSARMDAAFDRWRTGDYGERQFDGQVEWEIFVEKTCDACPCEKWCPLCAKFYSGDDDLFDNPCLVIKDVMRQNEEIESKMSEEMEKHFEKMEQEDRIDEVGTYISDDPVENWENDHIQFTRLIAECEAVGAIQITDELCASMDLTPDQIKEIIGRAQCVFEKMIKQIPNKQKCLFGDIFVERLIDAKMQKAIDDDARHSEW